MRSSQRVPIYLSLSLSLHTHMHTHMHPHTHTHTQCICKDLFCLCVRHNRECRQRSRLPHPCLVESCLLPVHACARVCVCACVRVCVFACAHVCACMRVRARVRRCVRSGARLTHVESVLCEMFNLELARKVCAHVALPVPGLLLRL